MKYGVNRQVLLITAGIVWIVAGAKYTANRNRDMAQ